jgi:secreted trypsin-like serine protease
MVRSRTLGIVVAALALLTIGLAAPATAQTAQPSIEGGNLATGNYPWIAALFYANGTQFCGGSLIRKNWVLTSAGCLNDNIGPSIDGMTLRIGSNDRAAGGTVVGVAKTIMHPEYGTGGALNDIALIKLDKAVPEEPVVLSTNGGTYWDNKKLRVLGWGMTCAHGGCSNDGTRMLKALDVNVRTAADCYNDKIYDKTELCTGTGTDSPETPCLGDQGGPLLYPVNGRLVGIYIGKFTSSSLGSSACGDADALYSRISSYNQPGGFIQTTIANNP